VLAESNYRMINKLIGMLIFPSVTREHSNCYIDLNLFFFLSARSIANMMRFKKYGLTKHLELKGIFFTAQKII